MRGGRRRKISEGGEEAKGRAGVDTAVGIKCSVRRGRGGRECGWEETVNGQDKDKKHSAVKRADGY